MLALHTVDSDLDEELLDIDDDGDHSDTNTGNQKGKKKKPAYRFRDTDDISLLEEVVVEKPVGKDGVKKWKLIFDRLGLPVKDYIVLKRRFKHLMDCFKANNLKALRGSGLEENYNDKMRLLTDIQSQMEDWQKEEVEATVTSKRKAEQSQKRAHSIRDAAMNSLRDTEATTPPTEADGETTPKTSRRVKANDVLTVLKDSEEKDRVHQETIADFKRKKLELMEKDLTLKEVNDQHKREMELRRMKLDEERHEMEKKRFEKDAEERALLLQLIQKNLK